MDEFIKTPTMSEIFKEEFMKPMNLTAYKLARSIDIPVSRIQAILNDEQKITLDTSLRLVKFFDVSDSYFLDLQSNLDVRTNTAANKI